MSGFPKSKEQEEQHKAGLQKADDALKALEQLSNPYEDPSKWEGLSDRQKRVVKLKMKGLSQSKIANIMNVSQSTVSLELSKVREIMKDRVITLDQDVIVGESLSVFEEVQNKAWALHASAADDPAIQAKALSIIMDAQTKQNKMLMDLGIMHRVAKEVNHKVAPLVKDWQDGVAQQKIGVTIIDSQLTELEEPEPPLLEAEFEEIEDEEDTD